MQMTWASDALSERLPADFSRTHPRPVHNIPDRLLGGQTAGNKRERHTRAIAARREDKNFPLPIHRQEVPEPS